MAETRRELPRLVIFDLDGTLVDTVPDIAVALNRALLDLQLPEVNEGDVRCWVGDGARALCARAISRSDTSDVDPAFVEHLHERFLSRYATRACVESRIYHHVERFLDTLAADGVSLAVVTNKPVQHTNILLDALGLRARFSLVLGGDSVARKKPDPAPLQECLRHFGARASDAWMVGDSGNDIYAARAAGMRSACVSYGYSQGRNVHELGADVVVESLMELVPVLYGQ